MGKTKTGLVCAISLWCCGCASIASFTASPDNPKDKDRLPQEVYGGTQLDYRGLCRRSGGGLFQHGPLALITDIGDGIGRLIIVVDMPMSVVIDTIVLPYTLSRDIKDDRKSHQKETEPTAAASAAAGQ